MRSLAWQRRCWNAQQLNWASACSTSAVALAPQFLHWPCRSAERLCSGRRHFGAIRSSGARTHRHRRVTASRGDNPQMSYPPECDTHALARPRRTCPAWAVSSVAAGGAPLRAMRLATGFPEARGTPRAPPVPPASSPGAHFAKAAIGSSKNITPRQERQIKAVGGKGMGSAGGAARRCARLLRASFRAMLHSRASLSCSGKVRREAAPYPRALIARMARQI